MHNSEAMSGETGLHETIVQRFELFGNEQFQGLRAHCIILCKALDKLGVMAFMVTVRDAREEAEIMKYVGVHDVQLGKGRTRKSFASIEEVVEMPDLIEVQKNSYERFLKEDLREVLNDVSPITDHTEDLSIEFVSHTLDVNNPKQFDSFRSRTRSRTFCAVYHFCIRNGAAHRDGQ